jgi:hypothetical protein
MTKLSTFRNAETLEYVSWWFLHSFGSEKIWGVILWGLSFPITYSYLKIIFI